MPAVTPLAGTTPSTGPTAPVLRKVLTGSGSLAVTVDELASAVLTRIDDDLPELRDAPWRDRVADEAFLRTAIGLCLGAPAVRSAPDAAHLAPLAEQVRALAGRGAPLRCMQRFHRAGIAYLFTELWSRAEPGDIDVLLHLSRSSAEHNAAVERLLVRVHRGAPDRGRRGAELREAQAERLLRGAVDGTADGPHHLVIVLPEQAALPEHPPLDALGAVVEGRPHLLVPVDGGESGEVWEPAREWTAAQPGLRAAGVFAAAPADVAHAAAAARHLLGVALAIGAAPGLFTRRDLLLELALAEEPQSRAALAGVIRSITHDSRLLQTLVRFFANDLDRARTAADLDVSRRGFYVRLDRITRLTGLDPRTTRGVQLLGAALAAQGLDQRGVGTGRAG